jgi:hypothetical protein
MWHEGMNGCGDTTTARVDEWTSGHGMSGSATQQVREGGVVRVRVTTLPTHQQHGCQRMWQHNDGMSGGCAWVWVWGGGGGPSSHLPYIDNACVELVVSSCAGEYELPSRSSTLHPHVRSAVGVKYLVALDSALNTDKHPAFCAGLVFGLCLCVPNFNDWKLRDQAVPVIDGSIGWMDGRWLMR